MSEKKDIVLPDIPPQGSDRATWLRFAATLLTVVLTAVIGYFASKPTQVVVQPAPVTVQVGK